MNLEAGQLRGAPFEVVSGRSESTDLFWKKHFGDDSVDAALADARQKGGSRAEGISLVSAEKTAFCFPACFFPMIRWTRTTVTGALIHASGLKGLSKSAPEEKPALERNQKPPVALLEERLEHLYAQDSPAAQSFYDSLGSEDKLQLKDYVVSERGKISTSDERVLRPAADATPELKGFLDWFIPRYTSYRIAK